MNSEINYGKNERNVLTFQSKYRVDVLENPKVKLYDLQVQNFVLEMGVPSVSENLEGQAERETIVYVFIYQVNAYSQYYGVCAHQRQENGQEGKNRKELGKRSAQGTEEDTLYPNLGNVITCLQRNKNRKKSRRKRTGSGIPNQLPWIIWPRLTTCMDHPLCLF